MSMLGTRTDLHNLGIPVDKIKSAIDGGSGAVTASSITDATAAGRALLTAANVGAQRTALRAAQITALTTVTVADATDAATAATLANANKAAINAIVAALKA